MKKTITLLLISVAMFFKAQTVADFDNFTLSTDSFYWNSSGTDFQTTNAVFEYDWAGYWGSGFSYTNIDDTTGGCGIYSCAPLKGYNNSNNYAAGQMNGKIKLKSPHNFVNGFYITNSMYAVESMKKGDSFAKKFGGASGNDPDWFKVLVRAYQGGVMKTDSVEFYLADFRFNINSQDYIVENWQWVNCAGLGVVDSIVFQMSSSDVAPWGMNTPGFFSIDNFTTSQNVGINELNGFRNLSLYPNPAAETAFLNFVSNETFIGTVSLYNTVGNLIKTESIEITPGINHHKLDLSTLSNGIYIAEINNGKQKQSFKLVKQN